MYRFYSTEINCTFWRRFFPSAVSEILKHESMDQKQLINGLQQGDESAFRHLVNTFGQQVYTTCKGFVHQSEEAEDITQEVFLEAFRSIQKFRGEAKLSTWLYRIAVNRSLNHLRSKKRKSWLHFGDGDDRNNDRFFFDPEDKSSPLPDELMSRNQKAVFLAQTIDQLPKNQKAAFVLHKYDELSYKEIAEILHVSIKAVEALMVRAKATLRKKMEHCYKNC